MNSINEIKDSGQRTEFETGAVRDMHAGKGRYDLLPWEAIHEVAKHCEAGAEKYGERNCEKGIPIHSLIDSAIRHLSCYLRGMKDEPHLRAAAWNVLFAIWMEIKHPEMQDIPCRMVDDSRFVNAICMDSRQLKRADGTFITIENRFHNKGKLPSALRIEYESGAYRDCGVVLCDDGNLYYHGHQIALAIDLQKNFGPIVSATYLYTESEEAENHA